MKQYELNDWAQQVLVRNIVDTNAVSQAVNEKFTAFQQIRFLNNLKKLIDVPAFHLKNKPRMFIFGAGGTTGWFLPKVLKIFNDIFNKRPDLRYNFEIVLIDADIVESKNIIRQNFIQLDIGQNKAQILSERYNELYPNIKVSFVDKYGYYLHPSLESNKSPEDLEYFIDLSSLNISANDILVNLVDNEGFKKQLDAYIAHNAFNGLYFAAGVNLFNGQVYYTSGTKTISNLYTVDHPDLFNDFEEVSVHACADADANGTDDNPEQMFNGNDLAASFLANTLQTVLSEVLDYQRVNFVSGRNISCEKQGKYYGLIYRYLRYITRQTSQLPEELQKSIRYVETYGLEVRTSTAKERYAHYAAYQELLEFYNFLETLR